MADQGDCIINGKGLRLEAARIGEEWTKEFDVVTRPCSFSVGTWTQGASVVCTETLCILLVLASDSIPPLRLLDAYAQRRGTASSPSEPRH